eukprot:CAMPEP_0206382702 /NCGR_PEP_ID=MMETSP0294-20121207/13448_1 /ASSEMBLY_ACC=CAM_ASM_000327 /TAXON_ID=39354 /ORGANISM="Heterosigma akashiwo, Strain CCMP2393" /LENGTH=250 /DNA_ID=CAMNT_0053832495 /DNA_START=117 /DNA_END=866 /DNA_ORIENTATION=-
MATITHLSSLFCDPFLGGNYKVQKGGSTAGEWKGIQTFNRQTSNDAETDHAAVTESKGTVKPTNLLLEAVQQLTQVDSRRCTEKGASKAPVKKTTGGAKGDRTRIKEKHKAYSRMWREKKKREGEILQRSLRELSIYKLLAEESSYMVSVHSNDEKLTYLYASSGFSRYLETEPSAFLGRSLIEMVLEGDRRQLLEAINVARSSESHVQILVNYNLVSVDGKTTFQLESSVRLGKQGIIFGTKVRPSEKW